MQRSGEARLVEMHDSEWPDRLEMNKAVGVAQQGHAPERGGRVSYQLANATRRAR